MPPKWPATCAHWLRSKISDARSQKPEVGPLISDLWYLRFSARRAWRVSAGQVGRMMSAFVCGKYLVPEARSQKPEGGLPTSVLWPQVSPANAGIQIIRVIREIRVQI